MAILLHDKEDIDNVMFTCVALQNIIAMWDGKDEWEQGVSWAGHDGLFEDDDEDQVNWARPKVLRNGEWTRVRPGEDWSNIGRVGFSEEQLILWGTAPGDTVPTTNEELKHIVDLHTESDTKFRSLREKLVTNFCERVREGSVHWMRS